MLPAISDILSYLCHQLADRTLLIASVPLPFCARCAGLYSGMAITAIYVIAARRNLLISPTLPSWLLALAAIIFSLTEYALTWFLHLTEGLPNFPRYSISLFTGAGVMLTFLGVISLIQLTQAEREERLPPFGAYNVLIIFTVCLGAAALPLIQSWLIWWAILVAYSIGTIAYFGVLNYFPFAVGFRLLRYKPGRKAYLLVGLALAAMMVFEYLLLRVFYKEYSIVYQWLHGLLEL
jgi:uncharacterized membrane protein